MPTMTRHSSITPELTIAVRTAADTKSFAMSDRQKVEFRESWQILINQTLLAWLSDPSQLEDEGFDHPTETTLRLAADYAEKFRDDGLPPPDSILSDPNGGIVFERRRGDVSELFYFWDDGMLEYQRFCGHNLVQRRAI